MHGLMRCPSRAIPYGAGTTQLLPRPPNLENPSNGALVLANARSGYRDLFFRQLMVYAGVVTLIAQRVVRLLFVPL